MKKPHLNIFSINQIIVLTKFKKFKNNFELLLSCILLKQKV